MKSCAIHARGVFAHRLIHIMSSLMIMAGCAALGYVAYMAVSARYFQETEAAKFAKPAKMEDVSPTSKSVPKTGLAAEGEVIGMIEIDSVGVRAVVVQGDSTKVLRRAVGHVPGTPMPGEAGNVALAAHRDTIFRPLRNIKPGDVVDLRTQGGVIQYRVRSTEIVPPSDVSVLQSHGRDELTLITCYPFYYVGHAPNRFIVRAEESAPPPK